MVNPIQFMCQKIHFLLIFCCFTATVNIAQIQLLNDEFNNGQSLTNWKNINVEEQWGIQQLETVDINTSRTGHLQMMPYTASWFGGYRGPLIYKEVTGDFVFTANIKIVGRSGSFPTSNFQFNLAGVMCRIPMDYPNGALGANGWQETDQNYIFLSIGGADDGFGNCQPAGACLAPHLEVKTTTNGNSSLQVQDIDTDEAEFRFTRIGQVFIIMYRLSTANDWVVHRRYERNDFPETVQIGFVTYTNWPKVVSYTPAFQNSHTLNSSLNPDPTNRPDLDFEPDVIGDFDFARFDSLAIPAGLVGLNFMNSGEVTDADLLAFLAYDSEAFCPINLHIHSVIDSNAYVQMQASEMIQMDTAIATKSTVQITAGNSIQLLPGFTVAAGTEFTAQIAACQGNSLHNKPTNYQKIAKSQKTIEATNPFKFKIGPNPFQQETTIHYSLETEEKVKLTIYDIKGRVVQQLIKETWQPAGHYQYRLSLQEERGQLFYAVLQTGQNVISQPLVSHKLN